MCERCRLLEDQNYSLRMESRAVHRRADGVRAPSAARGEVGLTDDRPTGVQGTETKKVVDEVRLSRRQEAVYKVEAQRLDGRLLEAQHAMQASKARIHILERELRARPKAAVKPATSNTETQTEADGMRAEMESLRARSREDMAGASQVMARSARAIRLLEAQLLQAQAEGHAALAQCAALLQSHAQLESRYSSVCTSLAAAEECTRHAQAQATVAREEREEACQYREQMDTARSPPQSETTPPRAVSDVDHSHADVPRVHPAPGQRSSRDSSGRTSTTGHRSPWMKEKGTALRHTGSHVKGTTPMAASYPLNDVRGHSVGFIRAEAPPDDLAGPPLVPTPMHSNQ